MNELQRQMLSDAIDSLSRLIDNETVILDKLEKRVSRKRAYLADLKRQKSALEEGVDW